MARVRGEVFDTDLVACGPAIDAVKAAVERGIGTTEISRLTDTSTDTIWRLKHYRKPDDLMTRKTRKKILAGLEDPDARSIHPRGLVPKKRTAQIVHSLCAQGFTLDHQAFIVENNTGTDGDPVSWATRSDHEMLRKETQDKAEWLARVLGDAKGPSSLTAKKTQRRGYFPLRHYTGTGDLLVNTLSAEQKAIFRRVQSTHDEQVRGGHRTRSLSG